MQMASIRREIVVEAQADHIWDAVRDVGALHTRLVPGFVVDCRLDGDARIVTFANGLVARETIVDLDDAGRRLVWNVVGGRPTHYNAALQVVADGANHARVVWTTDLLPNDLAGPVGGMMELGMKAMKAKMEKGSGA
jgi:hypothetical protein